MRKVIIAGGRDFGVLPGIPPDEPGFLKVAEDRNRGYCQLFSIIGEGEGVEIVSGKAIGADRFGEEYARVWSIPTKEFFAEWGTYGKAAGPIRNKAMADYADVLIAFWDGDSKGTKNMILNALTLGLEVHVFPY